MKVLFLVNIPSPYRVDFFDELGKRCDLTVLYELRSAKDRDPSWYGNNENRSFKYVFLNPVFSLSSSAFCPSVKEYLNDSSYDVIVVGGYATPTGMYAVNRLKKAQRPFILNCDGGMVPREEKSFKYAFKRHFISAASMWISPSESSDRYLIHYGADREKVMRYPFTSIYEKDIVKNVSAGKNEVKTIISVGNFIKRKGFDILIEAMEKVNVPAKLLIVGGEATEDYISLKEKCEENNPRVKIEFAGFKGKDELNVLYDSADLFVLATRYDIWGLVVNEAMARALPVITTDKCNAGIELVSEGGNGYLVPSENADSLSKAINMALNSDLGKMGERSLEIIRDYTYENMAEVHMSIFDKFIKYTGHKTGGLKVEQ